MKSVETLDKTATQTVYTDYDGIGEVVYTTDANTYTFRMTKISTMTDPSGDYSEYGVETNMDGTEVSFTLKGSGDTYSLAVWDDGTYAYSLSAETPISASAFTELIGSIQ